MHLICSTTLNSVNYVIFVCNDSLTAILTLLGILLLSAITTDFLMAQRIRPSINLELTLCIFALTSELGPVDMTTLNRPTMGVLASTQDQKKSIHITQHPLLSFPAVMGGA